MARILVAMSGGVDSSVAALLLQKQGHALVGVTMCLGVSQTPGGRPACCGPEAVLDARRVCDTLGIGHHVFDYAAELQTQVIEPFVREYAQGRTPNPCVWCNSRLKFGSLLTKARAMGFEQIATGHYARIGNSHGAPSLHTAGDLTKDQTYFLYGVERAVLGSIVFPLSELGKPAVRELAREAGLPVAAKQESQDLCFTSLDGYRDFVSRWSTPIPGDFVDTAGAVRGRHTGIAHYTVGQRKGLGVAAGEPLYVTAINPANNTVVLGRRSDLLSTGLTARGVNLLCDSLPATAEVKIRYASPRVPARVSLASGILTVRFERPQEAVTPGQAVVMYDGDRVLGGATIDSGTR